MTHPYARTAPDLAEEIDVELIALRDRPRAHSETWAWDAAAELPAILCRDCQSVTLVDDAVDELPCPEQVERDEDNLGGRCGSLDTVRVIVIDDDGAPRWSPWRHLVVRPLVEAIRR